MDEIVELPVREIDTSSIQQQMARNKEQLQIKLMVRRPISQLIEQGIIPPLRQSPVLYEQTKRLERARTEDFLKHKISNRPNRQQLIEHHILEDTNISPMLIAKQQQLKKAKLADNLNERLSHRPGVLELIKGNILLPSNLQIEQAVKEGTIIFKPTSAGETIKYPQPSFLILKKDQQTGNQPQIQSKFNSSNETQSNNQYQKGMKSCNNYHFDHHCSSVLPNDNLNLIEVLGGRPANNETNNGVVSVNKVAELEGGDDDENDSNCSSYSSCSLNMNDNEDNLMNDNGDSTINNLQDTNLNQNLKNDTKSSCSPKLDQMQTNLQPNQVKQTNQSQMNNQPPFTQQSTQKSNNTVHNLNNLNRLSNSSQSLNSSTNCSPLNSSLNKSLSNRSKKNKIKMQSKNKIIKFHEYKGPPNAINELTSFNDCSRSETAYELLLQQQQLYLQLELEMQQKQQLNNQQQINNQLNTQPKDQLDKQTTNSNSLLLSNNNSSGINAGKSKIIENLSISNNSEPNSPMQICTLSNNKESTSISLANNQTNLDQTTKTNEKLAEKTDEQVNHSAVINTSMVSTSMSNSPVSIIKATGPTSPILNVKNETSILDNLTDLNKIEEMKVNDLKQELKRRNLAISGSKTTLIERLKNHVSKNRQQSFTKALNSPVESSMEIDSPAQKTSSLSNSTSLLKSSSINSTTSTQSFYTNTITTPVTTFATLAAPETTSNLIEPASLLNTTAFLTQNPATIIKSTFNPPQNTTRFYTKTTPLIKTQTSLTNLKQQDALNSNNTINKPRRTSEPQLQHIQLHFTNPFLQFATTAPQSTLNAPLGTTPLNTTNHNSTAQQIHFLSTPALNTNDLHLFAQPLLNNRILQTSTNTPTLQSNLNANQPTTWTFQPFQTSNSFPQLFFYNPTPINNSATMTNGNTEQLNSLVNNSTTSLTTSSSLNVNAENSNKVKSKNDLNSSNSDLIANNQQTQKVRNKSTKATKQNKVNKNKSFTSSNDMNKKVSTSSLNGIACVKSSGLNAADNLSNSTSLLSNSINNVNMNQKSNFVKTEKKTDLIIEQQMSYDTNQLQPQSQPQLQTQLQTQTQNQNQPQQQIIIGTYMPNLSNSMSSMTNNLPISSQSSSLNYYSKILIDKPVPDYAPPNYEEATKQSKKTNLLLNGSSELNLVKLNNGNNLATVNNVMQMNGNYLNSTAATTSVDTFNGRMNSSNGGGGVVDGSTAINTSISMNANLNSNMNSNLSSNGAIHQDANISSLSKLSKTANLINSVNIGNSSNTTNVTSKTNHFQQSSSLEFKNLNSKNLEDNLQQPKYNYTLDDYSSSSNSITNCNSISSSSNVSSFKKLDNNFASSFYSNGININSNSFNNQNDLVNCINQPEANQQQMKNKLAFENLNSLECHMETESSNRPEVPDVDFNIDFDLLMEDLEDFEYNKSNDMKAVNFNENCSLINQMETDQKSCNMNVNNMGSLESTSRQQMLDSASLTIDTNFDSFNQVLTNNSMNTDQQTLKTPTLPESVEQMQMNAFNTSDQQIIQNIFKQEQLNSMPFDSNHFYNHYDNHLDSHLDHSNHLDNYGFKIEQKYSHCL